VLHQGRHAIIDGLYQQCITLCKVGEDIRESVHSRCCAKTFKFFENGFCHKWGGF
jgi:hypothetical protein